MRRLLTALLALSLAGWAAPAAAAESTLEKISRTGTLTIGTRRGSPPFGFVNAKNEWVGFSIDLVEQAIKPVIERHLKKGIKVEKKESSPATRIPLLTSRAVDLIAETMTDTRARRESVDFSLTFFVTGAQFLVKKGSPIKGIQDIAGKRIAAQQGSTNARIIRARVPNANLREFPDQPAAFQALTQGQVDAYTNDGIQLAGLIAKAPRPGDWQIVGDFYSYEPYGMAVRENESDFLDLVNAGLMEAIDSGKYFELYEKWFGPKGDVPYPLTPENKRFLVMQVVPK
ncbi:MAG: transporter substrate-binding domain-containing protein [Candidatus Tectomicrobia bacterium]|uniref:Transporter substrate-binding domain-containing protein n=1 Tax=Tectimicrobiota bacterium TaxID=2528274 RepID=A0A932HZK7_UNCTE|nr:transporter substrate-binding domain-containing protein [Candidatus Tectomicrobia bacterium]